MADLASRLKAKEDTINEICRISGTPGASIGVLHHGEVIYLQGFGYRDVERKLPPDEETIYYMASLSKAFTGYAVAMLVNQGKMTWETPIAQIVRNFTQEDKEIAKTSNAIDWMSHRTGLAAKNALWMGEFGHATLDRAAALPMISYLEKIAEFRKRWLYSNWGWALADEVIETLSGETWGTFLKEYIFDPLSLTRTTTTHNTKFDNVAEAYMALSNGKPYHLPRPFPEDGEVMEGAVAVQSCVRDLLSLYKVFMRAADDQEKNQTTRTEGCPLVELNTVTKGHVTLEPGSIKPERSYAIGWIRAELPTTLGAIGLNPTYVGKMPIVGKGIPAPRMCYYHQGSSNTFLNSVHLLPDTMSAVVVLTNAMANNDVADWLGEMLLETVLDNPQKNDYLALAKASAAQSLQRWANMRKEVELMKQPDTQIRPIADYAKVFSNKVGTFKIDIWTESDQLKMCFQGDRKYSYDLHHVHHDTYHWLLSRDEDVHYGRFPVTRKDFYLFNFIGSESSTTVDSLRWANDPAIPEGEIFRVDWRKADPAVIKSKKSFEGPS